MKNIKKFLYYLILIISFSGCNQFEDLFKSTGPITTEERHLSAVQNIELNSNVDLIIHKSNNYRMTVTAGSHLIGKIETNSEGDKLIIKNRNKFNWVRRFNPTLIIDIWVPSLYSILIFNASGDITCTDTLFAPHFEINSYGSVGTYNLKLNCNETFLKIHNGPADINVTGFANSNIIYTAGDGKFNGENFITRTSEITQKGINDVKVNVNTKLNVSIEAEGNIYYKGHPSQLSSKITGSGRLIPL